MTELKAKFRDELEKFAEQTFKTTLSSLTEKQRSDALMLCYILRIRNALLPGSLPDDFDELKDCICDEASDRTADFIYRDDNKHVTIIQSKHRGQGKTESESDFESFRKCLEKLCPETRTSARINQKVLDLIADIDWESDNFTLIFLSLARNSELIERAAEKDLDDIAGSPLKDISNRSEIRYMSEDEINKEWRDVLAQSIGTNPTVKILISHPAPKCDNDYFVIESGSGIRSYVVLLSAQQIHQLYNRYRDKLFNLNIRNYIGDTRTNKEIIGSAIKEPDNFFFYNNGISAVCTRVVVQAEGDHTFLECTDFSIINGAQTFRSISKAHTRSSSVDRSKLKVLMRVSEIDFRKGTAGETLDNITRYNNTQNSMRLSDFRSNDSVQSSLVKYIQQVPAFGGKSYIYRNKRTQAVDRNKINIKMDEFCRSIYSYQFGPSDYFGGLSHLYDTGSDGGYVKLFGQELAALNQEEFDRLFGIWLVASFVGELLKEEKQKAGTDTDEEYWSVRKSALERKYLVFFAVGEVFREVSRLRNAEERELLISFSKPRWQSESSRTAIVTEAFLIACDMVVQAYQIAQSKPLFVHRNFFRDSETLVAIRNTKISRRAALQKLADSDTMFRRKS